MFRRTVKGGQSYADQTKPYTILLVSILDKAWIQPKTCHGNDDVECIIVYPTTTCKRIFLKKREASNWGGDFYSSQNHSVTSFDNRGKLCVAYASVKIL